MVKRIETKCPKCSKISKVVPSQALYGVWCHNCGKRIASPAEDARWNLHIKEIQQEIAIKKEKSKLPKIEMESKHICSTCFYIFKGMPKKDKESVPTGVATTVRIGRVYTTRQHTSSRWTGEYFCSRCWMGGKLEIFPKISIKKGDLKRLNKLTKKAKNLNTEDKINLLMENGVDFGTKWG